MILGVLACLICGALLDRSQTNADENNPPRQSFSRLLLRLVIMVTAIAAAYGLFGYGPDNIYSQLINYFVAIALA